MLFQLHLFVALVGCSLSFHLNLDFMTSDDMERYFSVSKAEEVPEYEIVSPTAYSTGGRQRRHIEMEETSKEIKLKAFGEDFHMKLEENQQLLAEGLEVDIHNADGTEETRPLESSRCYYHGELLSHNVSRIAVSTCKGLTGMIATDRHDMYIRPLTDKHAEEYRRRRRAIENPHVIYRKSVDQDLPEDVKDANSHFCALDPSYPDSHTFHDTMQHIMEAMEDSDVDLHDTDGSTRQERATGTKYLEVRVAVDKAMKDYYETEEDTIHYTLSLMNVVAARFVEPSLDSPIIIHIVKLDLLDTDQKTENGATLTVTKDGRNTLQSWSNFQYVTNPFNDDSPGHWDNAVLISRKNLELDGSSSLLGIAWSSGTCYGPLQASVSEDQGLSSGIVIAHEIGHTLGMDHDDANGCVNRVNVMSSSRPNGAGSFMWSSCSNNDLNIFLAHPSKQCLTDKPTSIPQHEINAQDRPGSTAYDADRQCELQSDGVVTFTRSCTTNLEGICANLFCERNDGFCYSLVPAAEGTYCGPRKWCVSGQCVFNNNENNEWVIVDGPCSVTCGTGVAQDIVRCFSPTSNLYLDDSECDSLTKPTPSQQSCFQTPCPSPNQWIKVSGDCSATCGNGIFQETVRCFSTTTNSYVDDGLCDPLTKPTPAQQPCFITACPSLNQWERMQGPCSTSCGNGVAQEIIICKSASGETLADNQCDPSTKPTPTQLPCFEAECPAFWQPLGFGQCSTTCGTGTQTRLVWCVRTSAQNTLVKLDDSECDPSAKPATTQQCNNPSTCPAQGVWVTSSFSQCSVTCGGGFRTRTVTCRSSSTSQEILSESQCPENKPHTTEACNQEHCPSGIWVPSDFSQCSVTCGGGTKTRSITCRPSPGSQQILPDSQCSGNKPIATESCNQQDCATGVWVTSSFSQCSVSCGQGIRERLVFCRSDTDYTQLPESACDSSIRPDDQQLCNNGNCPVAPPSPPTNNAPDHGVQCAGVYTRPINNLDRISSSTDGQYCKESIVAAPGQAIKITFNKCNVRCSEGTDSGYVRDGHHLLSFCCDDDEDDSGDEPYSWISSTHVIQMEHLTVADGHGYEITVEFVGQPSNGCDKVFTSPTGTVTSPNYPQNYNNNQLCQSVIVAPPGKRVELHYQEIRLHSWYSFYCFDQLEVYDLDSGEGLRYCGTHTDPSRLNQPPHDNRVLVQFLSNNDGYTSKGFAISYSFVDAQ